MKDDEGEGKGEFFISCDCFSTCKRGDHCSYDDDGGGGLLVFPFLMSAGSEVSGSYFHGEGLHSWLDG